jgi:hypothetical protein
LSDRNPGVHCQSINFFNVALMLRPEILVALQACLADYPDWSIEILVGGPEMRVEISRGRIVDGLRHELLPEALRDVRFGMTVAEVEAELAERVRRLMNKKF